MKSDDYNYTYCKYKQRDMMMRCMKREEKCRDAEKDMHVEGFREKKIGMTMNSSAISIKPHSS